MIMSRPHLCSTGAPLWRTEYPIPGDPCGRAASGRSTPGISTRDSVPDVPLFLPRLL